MALKATDEPILIKPRSIDTTADTAIEFTGSLLLGSTFLIQEDPGSPSSLANAQVTLDAAARTSTAQKMNSTRIKAVKPVAKPLEFRACVKTSINVKPVDGSRAFGMLPMRNKTAISMPKPRTPLMNILAIKDFGTAVRAFLTSSDMWIAASAPAGRQRFLVVSGFNSTHHSTHSPKNAKTVVINPTNHERPGL